MNTKCKIFIPVSPIDGGALINRAGYSLSKFNVVEARKGFSHLDVKCPMELASAETLAEFAVGWMAEAKWFLVVVNDFNTFDVVADFKLNLLLLEGPTELGLKPPTFAFINASQAKSLEEIRIVLSELAFLVLRNEGHAQIVSERACLSLQDGYLRFSAAEDEVQIARLDVERSFGAGTRPNWVCDVLERF